MRTSFSRSRPVALAALAVFAGALMAGAAPPAAAQQWGNTTEQRIRCESYGAGEQFCRAPNDGRVRLVRNLSNVYCVEGRNWRADRNGIQVREGCRGEFAFMGTMSGGWNDPNASGEVEVRCESDDGREAFCAVTNRGVRLVRTLSRAPCVEGNTWRADGRGIYVRSGCRGMFLARSNQSGGGGWGGGGWNNGGSGGNWNNGGSWGNNNYGPPMQVRCQSIGGRWGACPVEIRGRVRMVRRESHAPCNRGMTWGTIRNEAIWVSDGCRAIFEVEGGRPYAGRSNYDGAGLAPPGISRMAVAEDADDIPGPGPGMSRDAPK